MWQWLLRARKVRRGLLVVTGTTGHTSSGTPERLRPSAHLQRNATVYNAARSTSNFPQLCRVRAVTERDHRLTHERVITVESYGFVSYAQQSLGTRLCRRRHDILRNNSLRMKTSQFMTLWEEMSVPPDRTTRGVKSLRMQTSCITTHVDLLKGPSTLAAPHPLDTVHSAPIDLRIPSQSPRRGCLSFFKSFVD